MEIFPRDVEKISNLQLKNRNAHHIIHTYFKQRCISAMINNVKFFQLILLYDE
jgi:hypothetical protein